MFSFNFILVYQYILVFISVYISLNIRVHKFLIKSATKLTKVPSRVYKEDVKMLHI